MPGRSVLPLWLALLWQACGSFPVPFDCSSGTGNWAIGWSEDKKQYCCQTAGVGCEATTTTTSTTCHQDCTAGIKNWEAGWSAYKKKWCCKHKGVGCPVTTTTPKPTTTSCEVDCHAGLNNWEKGWAEWKKNYCCKHEKLGCPATTTTTTTPCVFDCHAGLKNWVYGWAPEKKEWCCKHNHLGCPSTSTITGTDTTTTSSKSSTTVTTPFDCRYLGGKWSAEKSEWCCKNEKRGCTTTTETETKTTSTQTDTTTTTLPYNCSEGFTSCYHCLERRWPFPKRQWCCKHESRGCPTTRTATSTTTTTFDCMAEHPDEMASWASEKRDWCCASAHIGCSTTTATTTATTLTTTTTTFNCGGHDFEAWSQEQQHWCCKHKGHGCTTTTTPPPFNCRFHLESWSHWSVAKKQWCCERDEHCPTTETTTTKTTTAVSEVLTCDLNCFGTGARAVRLPGALGAGAGASLNDVPLEQCRNICAATEGCEAVLFTNRTKGIPWKSMCFGKSHVHTSKCQPGGAYMTDIIGARRLPWGKCAVFGDPHIITFDRVYGPPITMTDPGDYYLVKSEELNIHGRFGYTHRFPTASSTVGIAVSGSAISNHHLVVTFVGPRQGPKGFKVFWDGKQILSDYPSKFHASDGVLKASHDAMDPEKYHREGRHTIGGTSGLLPSYLFEFNSDLNIYILLGPDNVNAVIETRKVKGEQDGYCGNFNCVKEDDSLEALKKRGMFATIPAHESLFHSAPQPPAWVLTRVKRPSLKDCDPHVKAVAIKSCRGLPDGEENACIFDACAANRTEVVHEDMKVLALPFNCQQGAQDTWSSEKKTWCCKREKVGCVGEQRHPEQSLHGCHAMCTFHGQTASCFARVRWAAQHTYLGKDKPCIQAHRLVQEQCDVCSSCTAEAVGCAAAAPTVFFKRLYDSDEAEELPIKDGRRTRLLAAGALTGLSAALVVLSVIRSSVKLRERTECEHVRLLACEAPAEGSEEAPQPAAVP